MQVLNSPSGQTGSCKGLLGEAHLAKGYQVKTPSQVSSWLKLLVLQSKTHSLPIFVPSPSSFAPIVPAF